MSTASEENAELTRLWYECRQYTRFMRETVLQKVSEKMGLQCYPRDYYYLDTVFYREKDSQNFGERLTYAKHIEVAIEHENVIGDSAIEMNKLQLFNAPLKVLITYGNASERQNFLRIYENIINWADVFKDIGTLRRQLVIFGDKPADRIGWYSYVYENGGFSVLNEASAS